MMRPILLSCAALLFVLGAVAALSTFPQAAVEQVAQGVSPDGGTLAADDAHGVERWYKGNTHAHTVLSGHADSSPEHVTAWYHERGYNFLILSEHNLFIDPDSVEMPADPRSDFILIPGEEVTGNKVIHTTAMNIHDTVDWHADHEHKHVIIQHHVDSTIDAGGTPILNHPNFRWALTTDDILPVDRLHMFELYNGHPEVNNYGDEARPSTEEMWDVLLTNGMLIYGVSSDDAHAFQRWSESVSNPGRGWVMVRSDGLTPERITQAMQRGDFYASSGVILSEVDRGDEVYRIAVDAEATKEELQSPYLIGHQVERTPGGDGRFEISFIGDGGRVLATTDEQDAAYEISEDVSYVRAKITYRRDVAEGGAEAFYAWTQPVFTDERAETASTLGRP